MTTPSESLFHSTIDLAETIHNRAVSLCTRYRAAETELLHILLEIDQHRIYLKRGHPSLFKYVTSELGLSESITYALITVARKMRAVPELAESLKNGDLNLTNARRIASVLTPETSKEDRKDWIEKASTLSARKLEKEIAKVWPDQATTEHARYVASERIELKLGLSEAEMLKLRRVQDLLSQAKRRPISLEESLQEMTALFLEKKDPLRKAKRHHVKKGGASALAQAPAKVKAKAMLPTQSPEKLSEPLKREPIPAAVLHALNLRDEMRCRHLDARQSRCSERRWLEYHHHIPVNQGGPSNVENLITLCSAHHKLWHLNLKVPN